MKESKSSKWIVVAIIAAAVAAITTIVVIVLRARAKRKAAWYDEEGNYGFDMTGDDFEELTGEELDAILSVDADDAE
ncbi:MAG: hypothetical protein E7541_03635 [Ruminococcaceae bacterium]|nr:hypothetical protein [Oscillospiraceae bacterium]